MTTLGIYIGDNDERRLLEGNELVAFVAMRKDAADAKEAQEAAQVSAVIAKAALLKRLGITTDEAALLLG